MKAQLAEFLGTFGIVFLGTGSIIYDELFPGKLGVPGIAVVFGIAVTLMILLFGKISGAHLNPAVTTGFWLSKRIPFGKVISYLPFQFLGGIAASYLLSKIFPANAKLGSTLPSGLPWESFWLELGMTFALMLVILYVSGKTGFLNKIAAPLIGFVIFLEAWLGGPVSGASMNPARSLGPAIVSMQTEYLWIYLVATPLGAILASVFSRMLRK